MTRFLHEDLYRLHRPGGEFPAALNGVKILVGDLASQKTRRQDVGRGDGILNCEVDADAADRGHGVGGIADAQQAGPVPAPQPVDRDGQQLDVGPVAELADAVAQMGAPNARVPHERTPSRPGVPVQTRLSESRTRTASNLRD